MPLDLGDLLDAENASGAGQDLMRLLGEVCVSKWKKRVEEQLPDNTLKTAYLSQLSVIETTDDSVTFGLPGGEEKPAVLAFIAENGMTGHDMNEYLTRNGKTSWMFRGKVVQSKQGKVAFIPMEKSVKTISNQANNNDVQAVLAAIKLLQPTKETRSRAGERKTQWGDRLKAGFGVSLKPSHTSDVLKGMVRIVSKYSKRKDGSDEIQGRTTVFRTVTENGKRWHREATPAANIAQQVWELDVPAAMLEVLGEPQ